MVFSRLVETMFQENPSFRLAEMDFRANSGFRKKKGKTVNKRILLPLDKKFDSLSRNGGFVQKMRFHYTEKLISLAGIYIYIYILYIYILRLSEQSVEDMFIMLKI